MTGTNLQRKRSERGASLILLVGIIGLAFIVTVAGFLVAASNGQDTARLASAKIDVATREDALMREILQQTATGMLPGTDGFSGPILTWTQIMTNAANNLSAISYVQPAELATLGLSSDIPANTGDTAGTLLGIFNGYNPALPEDPFGGTSGLANVVPSPSPSPSVLPPLMNWSGGTTLAPLSSTIALTTPQEFFLGSQYPEGVTASVTQLSVSHRWGQIIYPAIRFGYKQPGSLFIARRVWWRIPLLYQTAQQTLEDQVGVDRYPSAPANYVLSVYEIPLQLPISGNANLQIGLNADGTAWGSAIQVTGSIYGNQIQLSGGTYNGVSSRQQVNVVSPATVGGVAYSTSSDNAFDQPGTREQMDLSQTPGATAPISVIGNDGKVLLVPVMPGNQFYMSVVPTTNAPTHWDLYARPYYRCRIRIIISGTDSQIIYSPSFNFATQTPQINPAAGTIKVTVYCSPDILSQPDQILGFPDPATATNYTQANLPSYLNYTSTAAGDRNLLVVDVGSMVTSLGAASNPTLDSVTAPKQLYSIYIGSNPTTEPVAPFTAIDPAVAITDTNDLSLFTSGLSIVCNQTLYLIDSFNQVNPPGATKPPPCSIYAPQIRYGMSGTVSPVALTGQVSVDPASSDPPSPMPVNPFSLVTGSNTAIPVSAISTHFNEITDPTLIPPIARMSLMFTIEKERTN